MQIAQALLRLNPQEQADCRRIAEIGSRLAALLILFRLDRPLAARAVARLAHIHPTTASRYLQQLADDFGFADCQGSRWLITAAGQAFFEPVKSALLSRDSAPPSISSFIKIVEIDVYEGERRKEEGNPRDLNARLSSGYTKFSPDSGSAAENPRAPGPRVAGFPPVRPTAGRSQPHSSPNPPARPAIRPDIRAAYRRAGIVPNALTDRIAGLPWITSDYIDARRERLVKMGKSFPQCAGLLISILQASEPPPPAPRSGT